MSAMPGRRWSRALTRRRVAIGVALLIVAALGLGQFARTYLFARKFQQIRMGDAKETVLTVLGQPTQVFTPPTDSSGGWTLGVGVETWAYGRLFKVRLFGPNSDDFAIEFDAKGQVQRLVVPAE